ncbi:hypothetical protein [Microcystis phage Mae-JY24]
MNYLAFAVLVIGVGALIAALLAHSAGYESPSPELQVPRGPFVWGLTLVGAALVTVGVLALLGVIR